MEILGHKNTHKARFKKTNDNKAQKKKEEAGLRSWFEDSAVTRYVSELTHWS